MRRFKRLFRNLNTKRIVYFLVVFLVVIASCVTYALVSVRLSVKGKASKLFVKDYTVSYDYVIYSSNPYNLDAEVIITSHTSYTTNDWEIYLDLPADAVYRNSYGAEFLGNEGNKYHFSSVTTTAAYIEPGKSVSFHIQFSSATGYELNNAIVYGTSTSGGSLGGLTGGDDPDPDDPTVIEDPCEGVFIHDNKINEETNDVLFANYTIKNQWNNGGYNTYVVNSRITNSGNVNSSWLLIFKVNDTTNITCYNGTCNIDDNMLVILPPSWDSVVQGNASKDFEFQITIDDINNLDMVYVGKNVEGYVVSCQKDYNGGSNQGHNDPEPDEPTPDEPDDPIPSNLNATFTLGGGWPSGRSGYNTYNATLVVNNTGNTNVNRWTVILGNATNADMNGCWNGTCSHSGDTITLTNNSNIAPGRSVEINYQITMPAGTNITVREAREG